LIFIGYFLYLRLRQHHHWGEKLTVTEALWTVGCYVSWSVFYVAAEWVLNIPSKEADLFPHFPFGRLVRNTPVRAARTRMVIWVYRKVAVGLHKLSASTQHLERMWRRRRGSIGDEDQKQKNHEGE
jgi:hypothetical protein